MSLQNLFPVDGMSFDGANGLAPGLYFPSFPATDWSIMTSTHCVKIAQLVESES